MYKMIVLYINTLALSVYLFKMIVKFNILVLKTLILEINMKRLPILIDFEDIFSYRIIGDHNY